MIIKTTFQIIAGKFFYANKNFMKELEDMKLQSEGQFGEVTYELIDSPQYWQFKYLHGSLLPDVAFALGETDPEYVKQWILKPKFLFRALPDEPENWKQIPAKHSSRCRIVVEDKKVTGYIPSTATLSFEEMKKFIQDVENLLTLELNGCIGMGSNQETAMEHKRKANEII